MAVFKFIVSNIKAKKTYSIVIFTLCLFAVTLVAVSLSSLNSAGKAYDKAFDNSKTPHINMYMQEKNYSSQMIADFKKHSEVESAEFQKIILYNGAYFIDNGKNIGESTDFFFREYLPDNRMVLIDGTAGKDGRLHPGEVILPYAMHTKDNINVNDELELVCGETKLSLKVKAFIENPRNGSVLFGNKDIFLCETDLQKITGENAVKYGLLGVRLKNYDFNIQRRIQQEFQDKYNKQIGFAVNYDDIKNGHLILPKIILAVLILFAILLCGITLIILRYSILATTEADYVNLGVLKALGFTPGMIRFAITAQYTVVALIGGLFGIVAASFASRYTWSIVFGSTGLYNKGDLSPVSALISILLLTAVISIFSCINADKAGRISPMRAISQGRAPAYFSSRFNLKLERITFIPFDLRMALKQFTSKVRRYSFLIIISALLVYLVMFLFGVTSFLKTENAYNSLGSELADIEIDTNTKADAVKLCNQISRDYNVKWVSYKRPNLEFIMDGSRIRSEVKDDFDANGQLYTIRGRHPKHDNEIAITNLVKKEFGKGIGDYVVLKDDKGAGHKFLITGIFQSIQEGGRIIRIPESGVKNLYPDFELNELYIRLTNNIDLDTVISEMKSKYTGYTEISNQYNEDEDTKSVAKTAFTAISNLVFILTIFMVVIITILIVKVTIHAETGELGMYKAMGFSSAKLRLQLALRFLLITLFGAVIGGIAEKFTCEPLASAALSVVGLAKLDLGLSLLQALIPMAIVILGSVLAALACSGKIKRISAYALINE